ncbi:FAD-dependent oxidoreductase [Chryseoglobus sp. KN1116]|uniref:FAD-dependent oxidoreductase n=1 Tax=Microcella pacifica TaxID=2591847 RepID=A0A9E5ME45_9MICO|nr:FAD-dependent oxidoreductase [Microcella pacifica]
MSLREAGYTDRIVLIAAEPYLPYQRPPLSKAFLAGDAQPATLALRGEPAYARHDIEVMVGDAVTAIDAARALVQRASGAELSWDHLVLAVGGRPSELDVPIIDGATGDLVTSTSSLEGVHLLRTADDALALRAAASKVSRLVAIGGSFIGLEVAASLSSRGVAATVLVRGDRLMSRVVHPYVADIFRRAHLARGVSLEFGAQVTALVADGRRVAAVQLSDGRRVEADCVVVGIGLTADTALAEQIGLVIDRGILVDDAGRTSHPAIYAAGDCATRLLASGATERTESVHNAVQQAKAVAAAIVEAAPPSKQVPWFWSDQFDLKLQTVGDTGHDTDTTVFAGDTPEKLVVEHRRDGVLVGVTAVSSPREFLQYRRELDRSHAVVNAQA